jgi:tetratricopeptide (TPR) repeat protein
MAHHHAEEAMSINPNDVQAIHAKGMTEVYRGELESGLDFILRARDCDPTLTAHYLEPLIECHYMRGEYGAALEAFQLWNLPPFYMLDVVAACQARLGRSEEARATRQLYLSRHPRSFDPTAAAKAHLRMIARQDSRRHWMDGYRKAGLVA